MSLTKINNRIYVSGLPKPKHWAYLKEIGIKHIINLMAESCYNQQLSETFNIKVYHVPVKNYHHLRSLK